MYCKKCGRKLNEGQRFCDHCGASVRQNQSPQRMKRPENRPAEGSRNGKPASVRQRKRPKRKKRSPVLFLVILGLCGALVCGLIAYFYTMSNIDESWKNSDGSVHINSTPAPTENIVKPSSSPDLDHPDFISYKDTEYGFKYVYPSSFTTDKFNTSIRFAAADAQGTGRISVMVEDTDKTAVDMLKSYVQSSGGELVFNKADSDSYSVYIKTGEQCRYRKCLVKNEKAIIYDFEFSQNADTYSKYNGYIDYIDEAVEFE